MVGTSGKTQNEYANSTNIKISKIYEYLRI